MQGHTTVETLIALLVAGILLSNALPSFSHMLQDTKAASQSATLLSHLTLARSKAHSLQAEVAVCASDNGADCLGRNQWESGWISFVDMNSNHVRDNAEPLISQMVEKNPNALPVRLKSGANQGRYVRFQPYRGAWPNARFLVCNSNKRRILRQIIIYRSGRVRISRTDPPSTVFCG